VQRAMSRDPVQRFQTADEFIRTIDGWLSDNGFGSRDSSSSIDLRDVGSAMGVGADLGRTAYAPATLNSGTSKTKTGGAWVQTNGDARPASGPNVKLLAGVGAAVLVAAAAAFALLGSGGEEPKADEKTPTTTAAPAVPEKAPTPQPEAAPAPTPAPAPAVTPAPVAEVAPAPTAAVVPKTAAAPTTKKATTAATTKKTTAATTKKTAATSTSTSTTKKSSRDFGY
jgi:hypothetical protein